MAKQHEYSSRTVWTGNAGEGTRRYRGYARTWDIATPGKPVIHCSNDPLLGGDPTLPNPEDLMLATVSACHMLWYLHLACNAGIVIHSYTDDPVAIGETAPNGAGRFLSATLRPRIEVEAGADLDKAAALHNDVHQFCFIARSINFPITYAPTFVERAPAA
jgi:organic hydroperoxide reductase OsmC/OhrA